MKEVVDTHPNVSDKIIIDYIHNVTTFAARAPQCIQLHCEYLVTAYAETLMQVGIPILNYNFSPNSCNQQLSF